MANSDQVRYITPFDREKVMPRWQAEYFLDQDEKRWKRLIDLDHLTAQHDAVGPPRIEESVMVVGALDNDGLDLPEGNWLA